MKRLTELALVAGLAISFPALAHDRPIIEFDAPGAGDDYGLGTLGVGINFGGEIAGDYYDPNGYEHGFIRAPNGKLTSFDPPDSIYTQVYGLNNEGVITGSYYDATFAEHGFVRTPDGKFTSFDPVPGLATESLSINDFGEISGDYIDDGGILHGFLRSPNGSITLYDVPGADLGTHPSIFSGLTDTGTVAGDYHVTDPTGTTPYVGHSYLRYADGTIKSFDVPGAGGTFMSSINQVDTVTGLWVVAHGDVEHGYVRFANGKFVSFDVPGAGTGASPNQQGTQPSNINSLGVVVGDYLDSNSVAHGFARDCDGTFTKFDPPGAGTTPFSFQGTFPISNNFAGAITGYFVDAYGVAHGFLKP